LAASHPQRHEGGQLQLAFSGPAPPASPRPLCLLDGFIDNASLLGDSLGLAAHADPELLLAAAYRRWGRTLPARLRGDFILVIWDAEHGEGLIARDQLGVRSLYLAESGGSLCFANELRDLLRLLPTRPSPDRASLAHWLAASNRPGNATLYEGVRRLDPGAVLFLNREGMREEAYWQPTFREPLRASPAELAERTRVAIEQAVACRIDEEGASGVLMSGGLDSATVAAVAAGLAPTKVSAYAGVFPEHPGVDESALIDELRTTLMLPGANAEVRSGGLLASALESAQTWQAPLLGWGDFWTLPLLRAAAAAGVTSTLGGDGGDELFGPRAYLMADHLRRVQPRKALAFALELPGAGERPPRRQVARVLATWGFAGALPPTLQDVAWRLGLIGKAPSWLDAAAAAELRESDDPYAWKRLDGPRWWAHTAYGITRGVEETGVFEHQRRRAALAGLDARHPLFDLDLLELALRQPPEASFDRHRNRPLLRASMAGLVPDAIRLRPAKAWFDALVIDCLQGSDGAAIRRLLTEPSAELRAYADLEQVRTRLLDGGPTQGPESFRSMHQLWRLVSAECWLRAQEDPSSPRLPSGLKPSAARVAMHETPPAPARGGLALSSSAGSGSYLFPP
jgi:asparagine synthase (glutamine-hydrolysing)